MVVARRHAVGSRVSVARGGHRLVEVTRVRVDRRADRLVADAEIILARRANTPSVVVAGGIADSFTIAWPSVPLPGQALTLPEGRHAVECACLLFEELAVT